MSGLVRIKQNDQVYIIDNRDNKNYPIKNVGNSIVINGTKNDRELDKGKILFYNDFETYLNCYLASNILAAVRKCYFNIVYEFYYEGCIKLPQEIEKYLNANISAEDYQRLIPMCIQRQNYNCLKKLIDNPRYKTLFSYIFSSDIDFHKLDDVAKHLLLSDVPDKIFHFSMDKELNDNVKRNIEYFFENNLMTIKHWENAIDYDINVVKFLLQHKDYFTGDLLAYATKNNKSAAIEIIRESQNPKIPEKDLGSEIEILNDIVRQLIIISQCE